MANEIVWKLYPGGKYVQACCYCGKKIPTNRDRYVVVAGNPLERATIRHPGCKEVILRDTYGRKVNLNIPHVVVTAGSE